MLAVRRIRKGARLGYLRDLQRIGRGILTEALDA